MHKYMFVSGKGRKMLVKNEEDAISLINFLLCEFNLRTEITCDGNSIDNCVEFKPRSKE